MPTKLDDFSKIMVISPHLDDGVLSVGGIIHKAAADGADVIVATAYTADTPQSETLSALALELHGLWDLGPNPYAARRQEDIVSVTSLGARVLHGDLLDALYRADDEGNPLYSTRQSVFSPPAEVDRIGDALVDLFDGWINEISPDLILVPLGVGRHVDHFLVTEALRRLAATRPLTIALYEDMPYSTGVFPVASPDSVEAGLQRTLWRVGDPRLIAVAVPEKLAAIAAYASQIADIFPNGIAFGSVLEDYMRRHGLDGGFGERIWEIVN